MDPQQRLLLERGLLLGGLLLQLHQLFHALLVEGHLRVYGIESVFNALGRIRQQ